MSALAKPGSIFTNAVNNTTIVPNEHVISVEKLDVPALNNNAASYAIVFNVVYPNSATKVIKINFTASAARNTSYTNWVTANAASVA